MKRKSIYALALLLGIATPAAAAAPVQPYVYCLFDSSSLCWPVGNIVFALDGRVSPKTLPKRRAAPISLQLQGKVLTKDGTHPPALRETVFDFDKHGSIDATGLPGCELRKIEGRTIDAARNACPGTVVGGGTAQIQIAQHEAAPLPVSARLTLFNGGARDGVTKLYIHATIALPEPVPIVVPVKIAKTREGRYGWSSIARIPQLFSGTGSLLAFDLKVGRQFEHNGVRRSYLTARCTDGELTSELSKAVFRNEAGGARTTTTISSTLTRPCTPQSQAPERD